MKARAGWINFSIPDSWEDVTLRQAIELHGLIKEMPEKLNQLYAAIKAQDKDGITAASIALSDAAVYDQLPVYYGKVIKVLTDLDDDEIERLAAPARAELYRLMEWVMYGVMYSPSQYPVKNIKYFRHRGKKYYLPKTGKGVGMEVPGIGLSALQFTQSNDFFAKGAKLEDGAYDHVRYAVAILCLPKGEKYDEQKMFDRAELFEDLPMNIFWEVFFFVKTSRDQYIKHTLNSFSRGAKGKWQRRKAGWLRGAGTAHS